MQGLREKKAPVYKDKKILLALLPFWTPLVPPTGLSCLKVFLQEYGFTVKTVDLSIEPTLKEFGNQYIETLKQQVPPGKRGNFYSIVNDVFRNQLMAHLNYTDETQYRELVKILVYKTFFTDVPEELILKLTDIIAGFYSRLETHFFNLLENENPGIRGLTVYSDTLPVSMYIFKRTREKYPHIKTVMGGGVFADQLAIGSPNLEFFLEKTAGYIDNIFIGEGEILFLKWLLGELPETRRVFTLADINGETLDLSTAAPLDLADFDPGKYPYLVSYTSRSCPFQCNFCSETVQWGKYRKKSAPQIAKELRELSAKHDSQLFLLSDSLLNPVITDLAKELINFNESIYWGGWLRVDGRAGDTQNTLLWRQGGFYHARIGVESGSPAILQAMGKKITPGQIRDTLFNLAQVGIKTSTLWIVGYPGETEADFQQTLDLIEELKENIYEAEGTPFWYFLTGQTNSDEWAKKYKSMLLYPGKVKDMLITQTWIMDCHPPREEIYRRLNRFTRHLHQLGIPNLYWMRDIYEADERWTRLHKNAVPAFVEFKNKGTYIHENKNVKKISFAANTLQDDMDFVF
jgi:hypothetical protein